jgi:hypothetical protein
MSSFGFIITRHVNSERSNKYWNRCISTIRLYYPKHKIILIDDNSNYDFVVKNCDDTNVEYIQSEFPGRGELLPFYYYFHNKWFDKAVIIHDSMFFHTRVPFGAINLPVIPLWNFISDDENINNSIRITNGLNNKSIVQQLLNNSKNNNNNQVKLLTRKVNWNGCFGIMCVITHDCLNHLQSTFNYLNLVHYIKTKQDRCCLERIFACMIHSQYSHLKAFPSLFGNIFNYLRFGYSYEEYINDVKNRNIHRPIIKVWSGR